MSLWEGMICPRALQGKSSRGTFLQVMTPDRIPQFTIPSLDIPKKQGCSGKGKGQAVGTSRRSSTDPAVKNDGNASGSCSLCCKLAATATATPDPASRAALSLPHLPKVTTPYGFVTLGQSPQVTSEEELFFHSGSGYRQGLAAEIHPSWQVEPGCCRTPGMPVSGRGGCSWMGGGLRDHKQPNPHSISNKDIRGSQTCRTSSELPLPRRHVSPLREIQVTEVLESEEAEKREKRLFGVGYQRSSFSLELPTGTSRRNLLQRILKRHLAHHRQLKPMNFSLH